MSSKILINERDVVVPGQVLAEGMDYLPSHGTYRLNDKILANKLGVAFIDGKVIKTIPLAGNYLPKRNDVVIGKVIDVLSMGWRVELNSPYGGLIPIRDGTFEFVPKGADLTRYFDIGDYFVGKITNVTSQFLVDVSVKGQGLYKLRDGRLIKVNTNKVPRIIGKKGSMVSMIKQATDVKITVGQNGLVWLNGEPAMENIAVEAIQKIENESHISGLTDRVKEFLEQATGKKIEAKQESSEEDEEEGSHDSQEYDDHSDQGEDGAYEEEQ
ncbi:MAG: KH domain-containing protein [Nanoarchaeota archaeon]|nr:KH domain-containing protein [Nanoarchaeota archaeon]